jgi:serine/threonine protein kinase
MLTTDKILQGRYRIVSQLGQGGMGAVYEAQDNKRFDASVALKEILVDLAGITDAKQQELLRRAFEREAKILAEVQHEVFPHVIEYFSENDRQFLVMELVQGEDLAQLLAHRQSPFPLEEILIWTDQLLDALDYLHSFKPPIFHRDLKPHNLKLTARGKIKLLDFGIAKSAEMQEATTTITNQSFIAATLNYSPFEQILRVLDPTLREVITEKFKTNIENVLVQNADARSDLYSLGATLYHLSTAFMPTDALKRTLEIWSGKPDPLRRPHELNPTIPEEISHIFLKAMEIDREDRFSSTTEMQKALKKAAADIKKREKEEAMRVIQLAEQERSEKERLEQERQFAEQERLRIEAEHLRLETERQLVEQKRLEKQRQLREAETQSQLVKQMRLRVEAEQERVEKERQLAEQEHLRIEAELTEIQQHEADIQQQLTAQYSSKDAIQLMDKENFEETESFAVNTQFSDNLTQHSYLPEISPELITQNITSNTLSDEDEKLPFTLSESKKVSWTLPIAALILLAFGGAVFGIWFIQSPEATKSNQTNSNQAGFLLNETNYEPKVAATPVEDPTTLPSSLAPNPILTPMSKPSVETKVPPPRVEKPTPPPPPTKTPPKKKTVTVDDLINDN